MSASTLTKWETLRAENKFEAAKAEASCLALPGRLAAVRPATMEQAMSGSFPTVASVRKYHDEQVALDALVEIIADAAGLVNLGRNLKPNQIEFLADEILREYYYLTLGDVRFMMRQGITGKYGELYDRLDVQVVMGWIERYTEDRANMAEGKSQQAHVSAVSENAKPMPEWFCEFVQKMEAKYGNELAAQEFTPDDNFWDMVEQEWQERGEQVPLEKFKQMRLAQTKAMFRK